MGVIRLRRTSPVWYWARVNSCGCVIRKFKIVLFRMLAGQYHTNRLAVAGVIHGPGHTRSLSHTHKKTQRVSLGVIRSEDQYGTGPSIYYLKPLGSVSLFFLTAMLSYEWKSIGESSSNVFCTDCTI